MNTPVESNLGPRLDTKAGRGAASRSGFLTTSLQWLAAILVLATVLRVGSALFQGNTVTDLPGVYDQISYDGLARRVLAGHGFSFAEYHWPATPGGEPTAHWSYLYTLYLAAVYALAGLKPVVPRLIQAVIAGIVQPWLTYRIGRRVFGPAVGLIAALLTAVYIYFFYYAGGLLTETFYLIGILWTFDAALRIVARGSGRAGEEAQPVRWWSWLELGLAIGVTVLLRQLFMLFVPFLFGWMWWNLREPRPAAAGDTGWRPRLRPTAIKGLLIAVLVVFLMIVPWTIRNYYAFGTLVPLNTNAGFAFFWGNHPIYGTHFLSLLPGGWSAYTDLIPENLRQLNEGQLDSALMKLGLGFVIQDPVRWTLLSLSRAEEYFKFWPSPGSGLLSNVSRVGSFALALPFMLYGLWVSIRLVRRPRVPFQRAAIVLFYLFMIIYTGIHLASWTLIRYRLPVDEILLIFAGLGILDLWQLITHTPRIPQ